MLALPAETGGLGQRFLHDGGGIDEKLDLAAIGLAHPAAERLELLFDDIVIVAMAGIERDIAHNAVARGSAGILRRPIVEAENDDRARRRPERPRIGAALGLVGEPNHIAVKSGGKKTREPCLGGVRQFGRRKAHRIEA